MDINKHIPDDTSSNEKRDRTRFDLLYKILKVSDETVKTTNRLEESIEKIGKVFNVDSHAPASVAQKAEAAGITKAGNGTLKTILLGILAGIFISFGAIICTTVTTNTGLGFGVVKVIGGLTFCLGLILVVIAGAELFTGNNLIVIAWLSGKIKFTKLLRNWSLVYAANLVGSLIIVGLVFASDQWTSSNYGVGINALNIANAKVNLSFGTALVRGILCNVLVCLAVWLCFSARTVTDKVMAIVFPITAFVAAGFEHSIANMYFIPMGILLADQPALLAAAGISADSVANLTWAGFFSNIIPVTIGNIIGGVAVGAIYWIAYLKKEKAVENDTVSSAYDSILADIRSMNTDALSPADNSMNVSVEEMIEVKMSRAGHPDMDHNTPGDSEIVPAS